MMLIFIKKKQNQKKNCKKRRFGNEKVHYIYGNYL